MTSRIKYLQFAILYPFTRVTNTKSMTPQPIGLGHRASKAFAIYPSDRVRASRQSFTTFIFIFLLFFFFFSFSSFLFLFLFAFLFFSFLEDYIGHQIWETQTYPRLPTNLRPVLQSERGDIISQSIGIIWCVVRELAQRGNFQVEHAGPSTDQKLNKKWNCSSIKATCKVSIFRLKAIQLSN